MFHAFQWHTSGEARVVIGSSLANVISFSYLENGNLIRVILIPYHLIFFSIILYMPFITSCKEFILVQLFEKRCSAMGSWGDLQLFHSDSAMHLL
jgi:hypothetical protein